MNDWNNRYAAQLQAQSQAQQSQLGQNQRAFCGACDCSRCRLMERHRRLLRIAATQGGALPFLVHEGNGYVDVRYLYQDYQDDT